MKEILEGRFQRAVAALEPNGIDAWIFCGRETNILGEPAMLYLMPTEVAGKTTVILTRSGERFLIASPMQMEELESSGLFSKCVAYQTQDMYEDCIVKVLKELPSAKKIALNFSESDPSSDGLTLTAYNMFLRCFSRCGLKPELVSAHPIMKQVRGRKSDLEVVKIANAVSASMEIYEAARPRMKVGMSGKDIQRLFKELIRERGLGYSWYEPEDPYISVGTRSSYLCKSPPEDVRVEPGDLVNVDMGIKLDGFASDNQRSFYALRRGETEPDPEVVRAFKTIQAMNESVCAAMKVGVNSDSLTAIGNEIMLNNGYPQGFKGWYGHEIGIFAHNGGISAGRNPYRPELDKTLEENMTFTLEPAIITPCGRLCQEEVVVVRPEGGRFLSTPQREVWVI